MREDRIALKSLLDKCKEASGKDDTTIFSDDEVTLIKIGECHEEEWTEKGPLSLIYRDGGFILSASGHEFRVEGISAMTMVLAARIVFGDKSGYYEIKAGKGSKINLKKYVIARELIKE